LRFMQFWNQS